ncbi:MAG: hypothetical protein HY862_09500 [Chloroflexi bacterium]|nr:hypothetical protein [Chloroflexota bacterium]
MKTVTNPSALFIQAIQSDSNHEMDWWWLLKRATSEAEREYCLEKILHINPINKLAQRELKALQNKQLSIAASVPHGLGWRLLGQRELKA